MPTLPIFDPPAFQDDFPDQPELRQAFRARWNDNINRYTQKTLQNDPWSSINQPALTEYYNPLHTDIPPDAAVAGIFWTAFPNRIKLHFPNVGQRTQWKYADDGTPQPYTPEGPRGWQDEYCEWSVKRNNQGKITRISFTCENREYWYTLWTISPERVLDLYRELVSDKVQLEDLYLRDSSTGQPAINPQTGRPAYNEFNKWNSSTTNGGLVHLISAPNNLYAETFLAGQATILREDEQGNPIINRNALVKCSQYGNDGRNSDPTIGAAVNELVRQKKRISLANPIGLYIQMPNFGQYQLPFDAPKGRKPADYFKVVRGRVRQDGEQLDYILHAVYEVPEEEGFTISDITINGFNIDYGSQMTETFQIALAGLPLDQVGSPPQLFQCAKPSQHPLPQPDLMAYKQVLQAAARSGLNLQVEQGSTVENIVLVSRNSDRNAELKVVGGEGVTLEKVGYQAYKYYEIFFVTVKVDADAPVGERSVQIINSDGSHGPPVYGLLEVIAPTDSPKLEQSKTDAADDVFDPDNFFINPYSGR